MNEMQPAEVEAEVALASTPPKKRRQKKPRVRKVAILGTTPSRMQAPIGDESWEIWTIGPGGKDAHRWDRLFEMHTVWPLDFGERPKPEDKSYLNDLSLEKRPVYSVTNLKLRVEDWARGHDKDDAWLKETIQGDFSTNVVIDRAALFEKYSRMWFSSSISYCIAMAIEEGVTDIGCWGIDLESGEEYIAQHAGCKFFLDLARLAGINLHFPDESCGLTRDLNPYPDRYETHMALTFEKKRHWIEQLIMQKEPEIAGIRSELARLEGQLLLLRDPDNIKKILEDLPTHLGQIEQKLMQVTHQIAQGQANLDHLKGEKTATEYYQRMYVFGMQEPA